MPSSIKLKSPLVPGVSSPRRYLHTNQVTSRSSFLQSKQIVLLKSCSVGTSVFYFLLLLFLSCSSLIILTALSCSFSSSSTLLQVQTSDWRLAAQAGCEPLYGERRNLPSPHPPVTFSTDLPQLFMLQELIQAHLPALALNPSLDAVLQDALIALRCTSTCTLGFALTQVAHAVSITLLPAPSEALQTSASSQHVSTSTTIRKSVWFDRSNCYKTMWTNMVWFSRCSFSVWVVPLLCPAPMSGFLA